MRQRFILPVLAAAILGAVLVMALRGGRHPVPTPQAAAAALEASASGPVRPDPILDALRADLALHRRLVLLLAEEGDGKGNLRPDALAEGHRLHHERRALVFQLDRALTALGTGPASERGPAATKVLDWFEKDRGILEMDRLAFRDPLRILRKALAGDATPQGAALVARVNADLAQVDHAEALAEAEYRQVYGGPGVAPSGGERKRWMAYVAALKSQAGTPHVPAAPAPQEPAPPAGHKEITGLGFPDKVLVLTFDDGPHRVYTEEIKAILKEHHAPAVFFEVGRNLGTVDAAGSVNLGALASISSDLGKSGFVIGNHSYTHAQLSKETGHPLDVEIGETDRILQTIPGVHSHLFRFPYGARTAVQLQALQPYGLRSVLWNIDSLDWADPIPSSVADRVSRLVAHEGRGIILFHDIHDRALKILPALLDDLRSKGYRFAGLDAEGNLVEP
jgi:peptidoglycan/xylan/chitin deacetylase (PgdA/CDA1 family)